MASKKQKRKFKARRFVKHLARFVDSHRYPNFQISEEIIVAESKRQTYGEKSLTKDEVLLIEPLRDAQRWKEVTIDGLVSLKVGVGIIQCTMRLNEFRMTG
jgi:uncharacterized NAD(P)/FAD-binding protein YdhS